MSAQDKDKKAEKVDPVQQEKVWKKKLKKTPPLELKKIADQYGKLKRKQGKLNAQLKAVTVQLDDKDRQIQNLRKQIDSIKTERQGKTMHQDQNESDVTEKSSHCQGTVFKVQIGVTQQIDGSFREQGKKYRLEQDTDGRLVYSLACFRDRDQAFDFQDQLKNIKVSDLYVVLYKDGKRTDEEQVKDTQTSSEDNTTEDTEASEESQGEETSDDDW